MNAITIIRLSEQELQLLWLANNSSDMIADSALALISGIDYNFATIKMTSRPHDHSHPHPHAQQKSSLAEDVKRLRTFLLAHFGNVSEPLMDEQAGKEDDLLVMEVEVDEKVARLDLVTMVCFPSFFFCCVSL